MLMIICISEDGEEGRVVMDREREEHLSWQDPLCLENRVTVGAG